jgi:hypothetical protein
MTRKHLVALAVVGAVVAAGLIVLHTFLPLDTSWSTNRLLHYLWLGATGLVAVGAIVWLLWPRPKPPRRDIGREQARRRVFAMIGVLVVLVGVVVFGEVRRDWVSRAQLREAATPGLQQIARAVAKYTADHGGAVPFTLESLVPRYLKPEQLYYAFRQGPTAAPAPDAESAAAASFGLAKDYPHEAGRGDASPMPYVAYLRPGQAWASLSMAVDSTGGCEIIAEDAADRFEWQFKK